MVRLNMGRSALMKMVTHTPTKPSNGDNVEDTFSYTTKDAQGNSTTNTVTITIIDDAPVATPDTNSITEDSVPNPVSGNVLTGGVSSGDTADTQGADKANVSGVQAGTVASGEHVANGALNTAVNGKYGTLILHADGSYTYQLNNNNTDVNALKDNQSLQDVFSYTITDGDGDKSTATITITINGHTDGLPSITPNDQNGSSVGGQITVYESGLSTGSNASAASESASGTIQINAGDGLSSINIGGQNFSLSQLQSLSSSNPSAAINVVGGTIVLNGFTANSSVGGIPTSGSLSYTYTLNNAQTHSAVGNDGLLLSGIPLSVTDAGGVTTTGSLVVQVIDDVPTAVADTGSLSEGGVLSVLAADGVLRNDTAGADGWVNTGAVVGVVSGDTATNSAGGVGGRIDGQYGYITLNADGSYTYVSTADAVTADAQDVFTYTVRDADGDLTHSTLTINVANVNLTPAPISNTVNESGLAGGSTAGTGHTVTDTVNLPSEVKAVPVTNGSTQYGTFSIDEDGHTYTLTKPSNGDNVEDTFSYTTKDAQGNSTTNTVTITIIDDAPVATPDTNSITEDSVPNPVSGNVLTGDVSSGDTADTQGADKANVSGVQAGTVASGEHVANGALNTAVNGKYGTLILHADGSYTYQLNNNNTDVNALKDNQSLQDVFSYTITDGDGDKSTATITITINGHTDGLPSITPNDQNGSSVGGQITVYESGLSTGSNASAASESASGTIQINAGDGLSSINIGGQNFSLSQLQSLSSSNPSAAINVVGGTIVLNGFTANSSVGGIPTSGSLSYTYTLNNAQTHSAVGNDGLLLSGIPLSVTGGVTTTGSLVVQVIDDVPTAVADTGSLSEGGVLSVLAADGVLRNDTAGADGWVNTGAVVGVVSGDTATNSAGGVGGRIDGQYGYITLNADGSYTYVSTADAVTADAQDVFTYTVRDADGDLTHSTLTINVANVNLTPAPISNTVNESGLAGGSTAGTGHTVTDTVNLPSEVKAVPVTNGSTQYGTFSIDEDGHYTYTLTKPSNGDNVEDTFSYTTKDAQGNSTTNTVTITIIDDAPVATPDTNSITEDSVPNPVSGNVLTGGVSSGDTADTQGADKANVSGVQAGTVASGEHVANGALNTAVNGEYGTLILRADGSYTYQLNNNNTDVNALKDNQSLQDVFSYTITDGDGDKSTATITITINGHTDGAPNVVITDHNGSALGANSIAENATTPVQGEFTVNAADGLKSITIGGTTILTSELLGLSPTTPQTIIGTQGTLTLTDYDPVTGKVSYSYQQSDSSKTTAVVIAA